jgi:DNA repair exonuclease SbcCD ATPase subunit
MAEEVTAIGIELKIREVEDEIKAVDKKIEDVENELKVEQQKDGRDEGMICYLRDKEKQLRDKEKQLRDKEKQLREEKKQLRDKENLLLTLGSDKGKYSIYSSWWTTTLLSFPTERLYIAIN